MKTLSPRMKLDTAAKEYIINSISPDGYVAPITVNTTEGKLKFLYNTFKNEYGWAIARYGEVGAMREWLQGLPSSINIAFTNHDILELAETWGYYDLPMTNAQKATVLRNWFNMIAVKTFQLFRKYKVN